MPPQMPRRGGGVAAAWRRRGGGVAATWRRRGGDVAATWRRRPDRHNVQPMWFKRNRAVILIAVALLAVSWGVYQTGNQPAPRPSSAARQAPSARSIVVDESSLMTAEQLARMPTTADERPFAEDALRIADNEMDLAFAQAVRRLLVVERQTGGKLSPHRGYSRRMGDGGKRADNGVRQYG